MAAIKDVERNARQAVKEAAKDNGEVYQDEEGDWLWSTFMGTVMALTPSGKYYTPYANSNVDLCPRCKGKGCDFCGGLGSREAHEDECWWEAADDEAGKKGGWVTSGEGSATDIFFIRRATRKEIKAAKGAEK